MVGLETGSRIMLNHLIIATHNQGKLAELRALLGGQVNHITSAGELGLPEPVEDGHTFAENALLKARAAAKAANMPALADDSGLCINALGGAPGVITADWTKRGMTGIAELVEKMGTHPDRGAQSVCVLALAWPDGRAEVFEGIVQGQIVWPARGAGGFGYDPAFLPDGQTKTYAEMTRPEKSALSHRRKALDLLTAYLEKQQAGV